MITALPSHHLLALIGEITLKWALIENVLDMQIAILFHRYSDDTVKKEIPRSLKNKIMFLRRSFKNQDLHTIRDQALSICTRVSELGKRRHEIVHGAIESVPDADSIMVTKFLYKTAMHQCVFYTLTRDTASTLARDIETLAMDCANFTRILMLHAGLATEQPSNNSDK